MNNKLYCFIFCLLIFIPAFLFSQSNYHPINLPTGISSVNEEFSGVAVYKNRLYILPQYGSNKETKLNGDFFIYSLALDSINRVLEKKDPGLLFYKKISVKNLEQLPDTIKQYYEGFEAITIVNNTVFLSIETNDTFDSCYILQGTLNKEMNEIFIDAKNYLPLKRYPFIANAGFESVTYLPKQKKLLALYEYNGMPDGGIGFLIDPSFKKPSQKIKVPFLYFRITDITATASDKIYGINYFWNGDYNYYLNNNIQRNEEKNIAAIITDLKPLLQNDNNYLKKSSTCYTRIVSLNNYKDTKWKQVTTFECSKNNWEGLVLFKKGALVISDANRNSHQVTTLAYIDFRH